MQTIYIYTGLTGGRWNFMKIAQIVPLPRVMIGSKSFLPGSHPLYLAWSGFLSDFSHSLVKCDMLWGWLSTNGFEIEERVDTKLSPENMHKSGQNSVVTREGHEIWPQSPNI
jgi:hypothetical protein